MSITNPSGLCECGCGEPTRLAPYTSRRFGWTKGQPVRFINGHSPRKPRTWTEDPATGCWSWDGGVRRDGYGKLMVDGVRWLAHRWVYVQRVGPIPDGLTLDHLCRNRTCVNPEHLEPVTSVENVMRGIGLPAQNAAKTHCNHGHELVGDNLYVSPRGWRYCRICNRRRDAERREKRRAA